MEINLKVVGKKLELTFSDDVSPETLVKVLAIVQNNFITQNCESSRPHLLDYINDLLSGRDPRLRMSSDFEVKGKF